ncbi:alpha/beta fold hydrolase [Glycomyces salinus]|uniref:alpha/beta fold hydrolase n=1 Tax=Glycomyces salinus TaxID=980294 RepID=UPI0018EB117D|nr:alpha/beta hydrolase [Glycomyces salinus]
MRRMLSRMRRSRTVRITAAVLAVLVLGLAYLLRDPSPVGYFRSAEAEDDFMAAYDEAMAELPEPDRTLDVRTDYGVVRLYHFEGAEPEAAPLLLLPGRASASPVWADNLPDLLQIRSVYTVDLLGEPGMSVQQRPITSAEDHAQWLHEVLMELPEERVHLLGLSIGGWTSMNLAVHLPQKVASLSLLDPVMTFADLSGEAVVRSIPASVHWFPKSWRDGFTSWTAGGAPVEDEPIARMIEAGMQSYVLKLSPPVRPSAEQLERMEVPTLVVLAEESGMHDAEEAAEVARETLPEATVEVYPDASHAVNGEYPELIAADLTEFFDRVE